MKPEKHPLEPFLPPNAKILLLGTFPPDRKRWSIEFFYPNFQNDMWRIFGLAFFGNRDEFVKSGERKCDAGKIAGFLSQRGIALFDTAEEVVRLKDNASDKFLEIVRKTDIAKILASLPECRAVACAGAKAAEVFAESCGATPPAAGASEAVEIGGRKIEFFRMPSSSRAYPKPLEEKARIYADMFRKTGLI